MRLNNFYRSAMFRKIIRIWIVLSILFSMIAIPTRTSAAGMVINANFDTGSDGFTYQDDTFRNTNAASYASGSYESSGGYSGGGLRVYVGAINTSTVYGMSGGWSNNFTLETAETVTVSFLYKLTISSEYESDEYGQALFSLDGALHGNGTNDYLAQINGNGNGGSADTTGWVSYSGQFSMPPGNHTIIIGNK